MLPQTKTKYYNPIFKLSLCFRANFSRFYFSSPIWIFSILFDLQLERETTIFAGTNFSLGCTFWTTSTRSILLTVVAGLTDWIINLNYTPNRKWGTRSRFRPLCDITYVPFNVKIFIFFSLRFSSRIRSTWYFVTAIWP